MSPAPAQTALDEYQSSALVRSPALWKLRAGDGLPAVPGACPVGLRPVGVITQSLPPANLQALFRFAATLPGKRRHIARRVAGVLPHRPVSAYSSRLKRP